MPSSVQKDAAFETTFKGFLRRQRTAPTPLPPDLRVTNQTAIVTGSNVGLGLAASRQLLKLGLSHLIMGVRSQAKGDAVASQLRKEFPSSTVSVWILDMASYGSICKFAEQCASLPRIDIAILNAGLMVPTYTTVAATGHELTMQVNYLSTALLAMLLIPTKGPILPQFDNPKAFGQFPAYANAKMLLMFFVTKLAERVKPSDVLINLVNPGMTKGTSLGHDNNVIAKKIFGVAQYFLARSLDVGASVYLDAALTRGAESHGSFVSDWAIKPFPSVWYTEEGRELGARLLDETMKELKPAGASLPEIS
ncbi:retinol dehydrogenase 12 [Penicillium riverlandense]|uniref:retinol dehydrogenase 12 n=1 Tax=Penicillium riverlandense TaxID=1903569 RepID=UPI0025485FB4|nr:retinol dehydrogenase 12 [Penicillium riverlandense]KAJ5818489.1 retinol dehydrogenase 12 [Penicillium riverlandense]